MAKLELHYPVKPWIRIQDFGQCHPAVCDKYHELGLQGHNGIDAVAADGTPVRAAHDGTVVFTGEDGAGGQIVVLRTETQHDYKDSTSFFKTVYVHLMKGSFKVVPGQKVKAGTLLALADNTGFSTGSHLHFGLKPIYPGENEWTWWNAEQENGFKGSIDPAGYFSGTYAADVQEKIAKMTLLISSLQQFLKILLSRRGGDK